MDSNAGSLLDSLQLGFVYESLMKNAAQHGLNRESAKVYLAEAKLWKDAIDANCGFDFYCHGDEHNASTQKWVREIADYDGAMGWRS